MYDNEETCNKEQTCKKLREDISRVAAEIERPEVLEKLRYVARCMLFAEPD